MADGVGTGGKTLESRLGEESVGGGAEGIELSSSAGDGKTVDDGKTG